MEEENGEKNQARKAILSPQAESTFATARDPHCAWSAALPGVFLIELSVYVSVNSAGQQISLQAIIFSKSSSMLEF